MGVWETRMGLWGQGRGCVDRDVAKGTGMGLWEQGCGPGERDSVAGRDVPKVAEVGL